MKWVADPMAHQQNPRNGNDSELRGSQLLRV